MGMEESCHLLPVSRLCDLDTATALARSRFPHKVSSLRAFKRDLIAGVLPDFCSLQSHVFWECVGIRDEP